MGALVSQLDLIGGLTKRLAPADEPLQSLPADGRAVHLDLIDGLWVRLADLPRALADRRYASDIDLVFDVTHEFCPWNAGRGRLPGGPSTADSCRPSTPSPLAASPPALAPPHPPRPP